MKPRIVRAVLPGLGEWIGEQGLGTAYLALPWPEECPWTPEQVMAACERNTGTFPVRVPWLSTGGQWLITTNTMVYGLTPEFMGEPKKCLCEQFDISGGLPLRCEKCGRIIHDRRKGERRKRERRKGLSCLFVPERLEQRKRVRRSGKDRRKP